MKKIVKSRLKKTRPRSKEKSIVIVLGMHRSGVSVVVRGLEALGVDFCDRLLTLESSNNDKSFVEEINVINCNVGKLLGQNWRKLAVEKSDELIDGKYADLNLQAFELLQSHLKSSHCLGLSFLQPAVLPFWQKVFAELDVNLTYIIVVRNPLSVADSLGRIASFAPEKCHYLWLEHILSSLYFTQRASRVIVDYDDLLDQPHKQISKIASTLELEHKPNKADLVRFSQEFLDANLRLANYKKQDVFADSLAPIPVKTAVRILDDIASDKLSLDSETVTLVFADLVKQTETLAEAIIYAVADKDNDNIKSTEALNTTHSDSIENVDSCAELKQDAIGFKRALTQRNYYIGLLHQNLAQHHETITALKKVSEVMQADIATLNQGLLERDSQVRALAQTIDEKNNALQEMHLSATQQNYRLKKIRRSYAWQVFKPLRMVNNLFSSFLYGINVNLTPLSQLTAKGNNWQVAGDDAQFLLITDRAWRSLAGWYWLEVKIFSAQPLKAQLFFDRGQGFDSVGVINFQINGNGLQRIPIFIPYQCTAIRFDPCDMPASFKLSHLVLKRLKDAPRLPSEFLAQAIVYEALGGRQGNASVLEPIADVQLNPDGDYCWRSESDDPWFAVTNIKSKLSPGWYVFEIAVNADPKYGNARLYFDYGEGYSEPCSVEIPYKDGRVYKRFYKLTATPRQIRFDPADRSAKFSIKRIHFFPVPAIAANYFMLRRLRNRVIQYKDQPLPQIWRALGIQAKKENIAARELLLEAYNKTFISNGLTSALVYSDWIDKTEKPEFDDLAAIDIVQKFLKTQPTVSIVMPVYNTAELYLRKAIDSVLAQSYPNWELCIADDASPAPDVKVVLEEYRQRDSRIKVVYRQQNGHISAASNSALELATGEYVALLDHDDELAVHALHFIVEAINHNPSAQILYSDEDKIDKDGNRSEPHFKSDWNPDLFFSQNYVSHLGVYRRDLLIKINGFRTSVEGSQDQDLLLRCLPFVKSVDIVHIPKVLYHWRALEGSTALDSGEKSYTTDAGIKALQDYFKAQGKDDVKVEMGLVPNTYRVRYGIPEPEPLISLLIPTRDMLAVLEPCIRSIIDKTTYQNYEIIILDNGSIETSTREYFKSIQAEDSRVKVVPYNYPFNYSAINNFGVKQAKGELIGLINNDVEVISPEWLTEMVSHALRPEIGCVGAKLYYDDETIQHAGVIVGLGGVAGHSHKYFPRAASGYFHRLKITQNLSAVTAACLIVRKAIFEQVGGLEEEGLRVAFNDVDFCLKVREAGYRNLWTPYAELYHHESKSRGAEDTPEKIERFNKEIDFIKNKWGTILQNDPYYSRNLTLNREDFSL